MPVGSIILLALAALVFLGFAHRVLDRMRLTDGQAILVLILMVVGSFIDVTISKANPRILLNIGGAVIPIGLVIYILIKATAAEKARSLITAIATAGILYGVSKIFDFEEGQQIIGPMYLFAIIAGILAYVGTRSRKTAFITGVLGIIGLDIATMIEIIVKGLPSTVHFGGAGVFDSVVVAGVIAVVLAEGFGETIERLSGAQHELNEHGDAIKQKQPGNLVNFRKSDEDGGDSDE